MQDYLLDISGDERSNTIMVVPTDMTLANTKIIEGMRFDTLDEWLAWQENLHFTSIELGLDRCKAVAEKMGLLTPEFTVVSVAGTNGKGSSVNMLSSILTNAGYKTGSYTSPHLIRYNERICINGKQVGDEELCASFNRIDQARGDISLTYFEFGTLAAFDIFQREGINIAILEVGLGGRLDAVNCLDADVALITTIDMDHENWLGNDRESIGREKAGIMRKSKPVISADANPPQSVPSYAEEIGAIYYQAGKEYQYDITADEMWNWYNSARSFTKLSQPSLYNKKQISNAAGVLMVLTLLSEKFPVSDNAINKGFQEFFIIGRFQIVPDKAQLIIDVAHNRSAAALLVENLKNLPIKGKTHVLIGMLKDKNRQAIFEVLSMIADVWHLVSLEGPRGAQAETLCADLSALHISKNVFSYEHVSRALDKIREDISPEDRIVITGSFLTVGAAIKHLNLHK